MALTFAFIVTIVFCVMAIIIRKFSDVYTGIDQGIDHRIFVNLVLVCFIPSLIEKMDINWTDFIIGGLAGSLMDTSVVFHCLGVAKGKAGIA